MSNKAKSIYYAVFAILYFIYTVFIAKHGIHGTNFVITVSVFLLSGYYYLKDRRR